MHVWRVLLCSQLDVIIWMTAFRTMGYHCPLTTRLGVRAQGSVASSPSWVLGRAPAENGIYAYLRLPERSYIWNTFFSIFERRWGPKHRGARKTFTPPLDGPASFQNLRRKGGKFDHRTGRPKVLLRHC